MKKCIKLVLIIFVIISFFSSTVSYGICNTIRSSKRVTAVRLTLQNGQVINDFKVDEKDVVLPDGSLDSSQIGQAKNLDIIFVVDTDTSDLDGEKSVIANAISNFETFYKNDTSKLRIVIIGFGDDYKDYDNEDDFNYELKNYKEDFSTIKEEYTNLESMREF